MHLPYSPPYCYDVYDDDGVTASAGDRACRAAVGAFLDAYLGTTRSDAGDAKPSASLAAARAKFTERRECLGVATAYEASAASATCQAPAAARAAAFRCSCSAAASASARGGGFGGGDGLMSF